MMQVPQQSRVVFTGKLGESGIDCPTLSLHRSKEVIACLNR